MDRPFILSRQYFVINKMKFSALSFLGLSVLVHSENPSLRAGLSLDNDEREAGPMCDLAVRNVKNALESRLPFEFVCSCTFRLFRPIVYRCGAEVCVQNIKDLLDVTMPLPLTEETCMRPSASGTLEKRSGAMTTKVCSGASSIVLNITHIEEQLNIQLSDDDTFQFNVPNSCLEVSHNAESLKTFTACSATIGTQSCPCEPCQDGSGVQLDCTTLIDNALPEFLQGQQALLNKTKVCLHPNMYDDFTGTASETADPLALGLFGLLVSMDV